MGNPKIILAHKKNPKAWFWGKTSRFGLDLLLACACAAFYVATFSAENSKKSNSGSNNMALWLEHAAASVDQWATQKIILAHKKPQGLI